MEETVPVTVPGFAVIVKLYVVVVPDETGVDPENVMNPDPAAVTDWDAPAGIPAIEK